MNSKEYELNKMETFGIIYPFIRPNKKRYYITLECEIEVSECKFSIQKYV